MARGYAVTASAPDWFPLVLRATMSTVREPPGELPDLDRPLLTRPRHRMKARPDARDQPLLRHDHRHVLRRPRSAAFPCAVRRAQRQHRARDPLRPLRG